MILFGRDVIIDDELLACDGGLHAWEDQIREGFSWRECRFCGIHFEQAIACEHDWEEQGFVGHDVEGQCRISTCRRCYLRKLEPLECDHHWVSLYEEDGGSKGFAAYIGRICQKCNERQHEGGRYARTS